MEDDGDDDPPPKGSSPSRSVFSGSEGSARKASVKDKSKDSKSGPAVITPQYPREFNNAIQEQISGLWNFRIERE